MHRTSIGTWAFNIGPYAEQPVPFDEVGERLAELGFDGHGARRLQRLPEPQHHAGPGAARRAQGARCRGWGLGFSGLAADLWSQHLIDTDDPSAYIAEFEKNADFARDLGIKGVRVDTVQPPTIHGADRLRRRLAARGRHLEGAAPRWRPTAASTSPGRSSPASPSTSPRTCCASWTRSRTTISASCTTPATARWWRWSAPASTARKETLPGGQLEFIEQALGPDQPHPPDRQRQHLPQGRRGQRRDQRACAVRRGRDRLRRPGAAPRAGRLCRTTGGRSISASGPTPGSRPRSARRRWTS